jgi:hypothetical protein
MIRVTASLDNCKVGAQELLLIYNISFLLQLLVVVVVRTLRRQHRWQHHQHGMNSMIRCARSSSLM